MALYRLDQYSLDDTVQLGRQMSRTFFYLPSPTFPLPLMHFPTNPQTNCIF